MKLIYSTAGSPFARKIRIVIAELGLAIEEEVRPGLRPPEEFRDLNPNLSLPVLIDDDLVLFDSNLIMQFLFERHRDRPVDAAPPLAPSLVRPTRRWEDSKILATIETFANTMVNVRQFRNDGTSAETSRYMARQEARIASCLDWLEQRITAEGFWPGTFSAMDIGLICPLAYGEARKIFDWRTGRPNMEAVYERTKERSSVAGTAETA